ncbi:MAG: hypothetical protein RI894_878 [Bacteroidota bacterium]|jgi:hypothetical protein
MSIKKTKPSVSAKNQQNTPNQTENTTVETLKTPQKPAPAWSDIAASPLFKTLFWVLLGVMAIAMPYLSFDYGVSGDENVHRLYGEKVLDYFLSFGADKSYCDPKVFKVNNLFYYGVSFDLLVAIINKLRGTTAVYETRHLVNALSGVFLFMGVGKLAKELGGWRTAFIALVLIILSPAIFGHSMNNLKDIPFAAGYIWTLVYTLRFIKELPTVSNRTLLMLALAMALTLSIRIGGLLVFPYLVLFSATTWLFLPHTRAAFLAGGTHSFAAKLALVLVGAYILGIITWPYALESPISHPLEALGAMEKFGTSIRMLFEGKMIFSNEVPWYYIPKYFLMTSPIVIFVGIITTKIMFFVHRRNGYMPLLLGILAFAATFPVVYAIYKQSPLYDGMRHFLFIYPVIVAICAYGFDSVLDYFNENNGVKYGFTAVIGLLCLLPLKWMIQNHPHQYIYFNEFMGGEKGAFGEYETDYWMNSTRPMAKWFMETYKKDLESGKKMYIGSDCIDQIDYEIHRRYPNAIPTYVPYANRSDKKWDYAIFVTRFIDPDLLKSGWFPGDKAIHTELVDGVPVGAVLARKEGFDLRGSEALKANNLALADSCYTAELAKYPRNEAVRFNLANLYTQLGKVEEAKKQYNAVLAVAPNHTFALKQLGMIYLKANDMKGAEDILLRVYKNGKDPETGYYLAIIYMQKGDVESAAHFIDEVLLQQPDLQAALDLQKQIYSRRR